MFLAGTGGGRLVKIDQEPVIRVGVLTGVREVKFALKGRFVSSNGETVQDGDYMACAEDGAVKLGNTRAPEITLSPTEFDSCRFTVHGVKIGINFHWEREESQQ